MAGRGKAAKDPLRILRLEDIVDDVDRDLIAQRLLDRLEAGETRAIPILRISSALARDPIPVAASTAPAAEDRTKPRRVRSIVMVPWFRPLRVRLRQAYGRFGVST